ncbi:DNA polymerase III subunit gamma/tau [Accumulibacter sp.]|uniref:DNA polymerase III subunit gamma/tau n=1 Tax=Accumulibacter sp. TaxID=2053492 RepID=UPI0025E33881|nr:DNA polymerase III subunit gamma/tau [Accumulibacter sp.]MCM8610907.1 DNA polymerase III subunit gamma/tau [Accumulibacter sp.]MCM8634727.1 DNA polymerase III subunit gamma/tau [Accumulibacter sp.]MCM8638281.1 DNA polymerase III subunit gamma/tau [Accumulibacter sp.]
MSYQVLARKWRPRTFASLVGQEHVVRALEHALTAQRLHHAYLFTGTRGVGKTTLARILAKALNCETGVTAAPCGLCSACQEIDAGRFVDLLEVDAATNTRVDEMRQLLDNAVYAPTRGRFKVYVIDEVHMLSNSAFNAMLKTLEEPPEHVKFILATTDPQKIPVTVLSRCLQFNLKQMTPPLIASHLRQILEEEAIGAEAGALQLLARSAAGSMRDALSLLDQAIAHGSGRVEEALVRQMLGAVDLDHLFSILDALLAGDPAGMLQVADDMAARSLSFDAALQELAALFTRVQVAQLAPQAIADDLPERARLLGIAARLDPEYVQLAYQMAVHGRQELPLAPDEQAGFVMTLLRLHAFRPESEEAASGRALAAASSAGRPSTKSLPLADATRPSQPSRADASVGVGRAAPPPTPPLVPARVGPGPASPASDWHELLAAIKPSGMARELAQHCELCELAAGRIQLQLAPRHRHLLMRAAQDKLQQALVDYFAMPMQLGIAVAEGAGDTPAAAAQRDRQERMDRAIASVEQDGFVREIIEMFDATLIESSIKPV